MPIAEFRLPDGRIAEFRVPEGTTPEQAQRMIAPMIPGIIGSQQPEPAPKEPPGIFSQIVGAPKEFVKGFTRGITVDPLSGVASLGYTGARAAGAELTPFEQTTFGKGLAGAQEYLAPSDTGVVTQVAGGLGSLASFIPGGLLKGGIKLATLGTQAMGLGSEEARSRAEQAQLEGTAVSPEQQFQAQLLGTGVGLTELAPVERLSRPLRALFRGMKPEDAAKYAPGISAAVRRMAVTGGIEGAQEGLANLAQDFIQQGIYDPSLEIGQSALGDAAMGATVGAIAQGTVDFITRGKRAEAYRQLKTQEEERQNAVLRADELKKIQETSQRLGIDPNVLALPAPSPAVEETEQRDPLMNPVGFFSSGELTPDYLKYVNKMRENEGKSKLKQFSIEDLADAGAPQGEIDRLLTYKTKFDGSIKLVPQDVLNIAREKNIDTSTSGFTDFLRRTTGSENLGKMSQPQLFSAFKSLGSIDPSDTLQVLPQGTNATRFTTKQYNDTIGKLKTALSDGPVGRSSVLEQIKGYSLLENNRDIESLLQTAIRNGDLDTVSTPRYINVDQNGNQVGFSYQNRKNAEEAASKKGLSVKESTSINIALPGSIAQFPGLPDIREGKFKEGVEPIGFQVLSPDAVLTTSKTQSEAEAKAERLTALRLQKAEDKLNEIKKTESQIAKNIRKLESMEADGKAGTLEYNQLSAKITANNKNLDSKINRLKAEAESYAQPLEIAPKGEKPITRDGYTLFKDGVPVATFPTQDAAYRESISRLNDNDLQIVASLGRIQPGPRPKALSKYAKEEMDRRAGTTPAKGIGIEITGTREEAEARLAEAGIFVGEFQQKAAELSKKLRPIMDKLGLKDLRLNIEKAITSPMGEADGYYARRLIAISMTAPNPIRTLRHEGIHALKELGAFTTDQWRVLTNKAKSEWIDKYDIRNRYRSLNEEEMIEEAISDAFSDFDQTKPPSGLIGALFRKIKQFMEFLGNGIRGLGFQTAEDVFTRVEEGGLKPISAETVEAAPRYAMRVAEPESPLAQYVSPAEAEARLRRRLGRAEDIGAPSNDRMTFGRGREKLIVGKITPQDWKERVQNTMSVPEIEDARNWYQQLNDFFTPVFGDRASEYSLAWLLSQQRASPTKGFTDVLRASDIAENKLRIKKAGLNEKSLVAALRGEVPEGGIGAKLLDFVDSELGKSVRTVMGGKKEGRQPAAIDVWAQRDIGFIDDTVKEFVAKKFGKEAADMLDVDTARFGEPQYEYGVDFYNDVAEYLNRQKYMGGGWTAREVQAVGWVNMQKFMGVKPEFVRDIVNGNTRRVSIGLAPGTGSVMTGRLMGKEIPVKDAQNIINDLAKISNIKVTQSIDGIGAYLTYVEGSIQVDAVGSPESVDSFMDMIGYVFQQTEVINTRPLASGKNSAIDILSPSLNSQSKAIEFFTEYLKAMPKDSNGDPIAPGFQQIKVDGVPGIRLVNFGGKWNKKQLEALAKAADVAEAATGIKDAQFVDMNVQFTSTKNDWVKYPDGEQYVDSLRNRGRLQEAQLLRDQFPPTRFDLAGDGTINWRPRLAFRPDESIDRSGLGSGISIREQQPNAQSYDAVHYGKQRVNTLAGSMYGTGIKGAEAQRVFASPDPRVRQRAYFYIPYPNGRMPRPEAGLGSEVHIQRLNNLLGPGDEMQSLVDATRAPDGRMDANAFESAVIDAGYDGYAVPDMGMAVVLGADVPVIPREGGENTVQIGDRKYALRQTDTPEFKQWFGDSKIVNDVDTGPVSGDDVMDWLKIPQNEQRDYWKNLNIDEMESLINDYRNRKEVGAPKIMYHGTARDITEFKPKQANAIFLTDDPQFAKTFTEMSENYMADEFFKGLSEPEKSVYRKRAEKLAKRNDTNAADELLEIIKDQLPSRANIMPLYVRAENPFDYENPDHLKQLSQTESGKDLYSEELERIGFGAWALIESPQIQRAIKEAGFDGFYIMEGGRKNLAVYDPNQIKSAIGNIGTFSRTDKDIRYALALGNIEPSTALVPDDGGNPDGNMGLLPERLGAKPIRLLVGTHDDIENKGYGANHILNRVLSDPRRMPEGSEETLEKIARTAQRTAQNYKQIFKDGNKLVLFDGKNSLVLSSTPDQASIVTMFTQANPQQKYGAPVWSGRAPAMAEFLEPVRGLRVEEREGRVAPQVAKSVVTPSRVLEVAPITEMAPTKAGKLGLKPKMSLRAQPMDIETAQRIPQDTFNVDPNTSRDNTIYLLQDKQIDLKRVIEGIRKAGKDVIDRWNAYLKEELFHGRSATRIRFFADRELQPLLKKMEAANISLDQMDTYLLARHAKEANEYIRSINPDPTANAGMTDQQAENYMRSLPSPRRAAFERIAKDVDAMTKQTRNLMVEYGLEKPETIATWEKTYKNYVPLFREETEGSPISIGRGYNIRGRTVGQRTGSSKKVVDILANIAMQRERTIVRGEKNRVGNALYGLVLENTNKGFWGVINPEKTNKSVLRQELMNLGIDPDMVDEMIAKPVEKKLDKKTGLVVYQVPPLWKNAENIFITRINGEDRVIGFNKNDERAMRMVSTLKNLDAQQQGEAIRMMGTAGDYYRKVIEGAGKGTRFFASVNTQYNPAFGIYNLMRDIGGATLNLQSTPLKGKERKILGDAFTALKDVYRDLRRSRNGLEADSKWAEIFEEFELEGGKTGYRDMFENAQDRADKLQKDIENFGKGKFKGTGSAIMNWLSDFNDAIENAVRVSVYKNALDQGISKERAASLAKNITVNFNRTGAISRNFQTLYAFFNASVQGTARIAQTLLTKDGKLSPIGKKIVMGGLTLGLAQAVLLAMAGLDDDEVPDFVKDKNFVIPTGDGKYLAIPMPLGYNIIPGFGRRVMEFAMSDNKNVGKSVFETSQMILDGFNPLGSATFVQTLSPTLLDPIVALAENKDFTGKPIAREDINSLRPTPGYTRGSQNSFAITEGLAYAINLLSGGTEFKKGVISPTPDQIEYLVGQVFGGVGREAMKIGRGLEAMATGEELATYNIPIAGRMIGNVQQKAAQTSRFYENVKRLNEHQEEIEGRMLKGQDISDYIDQYPEASMYQVGDKIYSKISKLRQIKKSLQESGASRDDIKVIDESMLGLMVSLNQIYESARQR